MSSSQGIHAFVYQIDSNHLGLSHGTILFFSTNKTTLFFSWRIRLSFLLRIRLKKRDKGSSCFLNVMFSKSLLANITKSFETKKKKGMQLCRIEYWLWYPPWQVLIGFARIRSPTLFTRSTRLFFMLTNPDGMHIKSTWINPLLLLFMNYRRLYDTLGNWMLTDHSGNILV